MHFRYFVFANSSIGIDSKMFTQEKLWEVYFLHTPRRGFKKILQEPSYEVGNDSCTSKLMNTQEFYYSEKKTDKPKY